MKKFVVLVVSLLLFVSLPSLMAKDNSGYIKWFQQRVWVLPNKTKVPMYQAFCNYLGKFTIKHEMDSKKTKNFIVIQGEASVNQSMFYSTIYIMYLVRKDPFYLEPVMFAKNGVEDKSGIIMRNFLGEVINFYLK